MKHLCEWERNALDITRFWVLAACLTFVVFATDFPKRFPESIKIQQIEEARKKICAPLKPTDGYNILRDGTFKVSCVDSEGHEYEIIVETLP